MNQDQLPVRSCNRRYQEMESFIGQSRNVRSNFRLRLIVERSFLEYRRIGATNEYGFPGGEVEAIERPHRVLRKHGFPHFVIAHSLKVIRAHDRHRMAPPSLG